MMRILVFLFLFLNMGLINGQTIQFRFCARTSHVIPTNDQNGIDQRHKGQVILDFMKVGIVGKSASEPFYVVGEPSIGPVTFADDTFIDGCVNNPKTNPTCNLCNRCADPYYGLSIKSGTTEGVYVDNVRLLGSNHNLHFQSTDSIYSVCYVTNKIDLTAYQRKRIEITVKYVGGKEGPFSTKNINMHYQYNNEGWLVQNQLFNKNSGFIGTFEELYPVQVAVPNAINDLSNIANLEIIPSPVNDQMRIKMEILNAFEGEYTIINELGKQVLNKDFNFATDQNSIEVNTSSFPSGFYILKINDKEGKTRSLKFSKQ